MEVYCVFKYTYDVPELINIYTLAERAQEEVDMMNGIHDTEDYHVVDWEVT